MKVNVSAIVVRQGKVLLIQRNLNDKHFPGRWGIPGGGMEDEDDSIEATAVREVQEEVGLDIIPGAIRFNNRNGDVLFIAMTASLVKGQTNIDSPVTSDEVHASKWAGPEDLESLKFTPFTKERLISILKENAIDAKK